ncbi:MAG: helix-turn-helix domain-containing protein [Chitinophagaceae bacterium]|nr:helix-turn-helix domain-containing protein [Chitinophagaceae bacterium]
MAIYLIASGSTLDEMARYLPLTLTDLRKISGFGDAKVEKYGLQFLDIIIRYCNEHDLETNIHEKAAKRERKEKPTTAKVDTKKESFKLYKAGKTVAEIATERNLTVTTIETHLAHFVSTGEINIDEFLSTEKVNKISLSLEEFEEGTSLTSIKEKLGDEISYGAIRMVMAWKDFVETKQMETKKE